MDIELSSGHEASVVFHERRHFMEVLAPLEAGVEVGLADLLAALNVVPDAITWTHDRIDRSAIEALQTVMSRSDEPSVRVRRTSAVLPPSAKEARAKDVYEKYYGRLVSAVRAYRLPEDDAEDLAQEALVRFYESMDAYRGDAEWPLLETLARRAILNRIRAQKAWKRAAMVEVPLSEADGLVPAALGLYAEREESARRRKLLHDAVAELPARQRQCLQLSLDGFKHEEIASALRISTSTVRTQLRSATEQLRKLLHVTWEDEP